MDIEIRQATEEDINQICEIENESFSVPWSREAFNQSINQTLSTNYKAYVAVRDGEVEGYIITTVLCPEIEILDIAVAAGSRKQGIAEKLIRFIINLSQSLGMEVCYLEVRESNLPARALYEKLGFRQLGIRRGYYTHPKEDAIIMSLPLITYGKHV